MWGACAGGMTVVAYLGHMAAVGHRKVANTVLPVSVLDSTHAMDTTMGLFVTPQSLQAVRKAVARKGYVDGKQMAQALIAAHHLGLGKADRLAGQLGNFLMRVFLDVEQPEHAARERRQSGQGTLDIAGVGACPGLRGVACDAVVLGQGFENDASLATHAHQGFIDHDLPQPAPERGVAAKLCNALEQAKHGVVHRLACVLGIAEHAQGQRVGGSLECAIDGFQCAQVAAPRACQHGVGKLDLEAGGAHGRFGCGAAENGRNDFR